MKRLLPLLLPILTVLPGCSVSSAINAFVPSSGYRVVPDIPYGEGQRRTLDVYVPDGADGGTPMLVFFYGGSWDSGEKEAYRFAGQAFASRGYVTAIPDYRIYPEVRFPDFLKDASAAVAWAVTHGGEYGAAPGPVFLAGHSAGAHIAAMLTLDRQWLGGGPVAVRRHQGDGRAGGALRLPAAEERGAEGDSARRRPGREVSRSTS